MGKFIKDEDIQTRQNGTKMLLFRNFSCKDGRYKANYPNFNVVLDAEKASELAEEGYPIKEYEDRDGNTQYRMKINVRFDNIPPTVYKICGNNRVRLDDISIADLDRDEIIKLDMMVSLSSGGAVYMNKGYFTIDEDELDRLYAQYDMNNEPDGEIPFN